MRRVACLFGVLAAILAFLANRHRVVIVRYSLAKTVNQLVVGGPLQTTEISPQQELSHYERQRTNFLYGHIRVKMPRLSNSENSPLTFWISACNTRSTLH